MAVIKKEQSKGKHDMRHILSIMFAAAMVLQANAQQEEPLTVVAKSATKTAEYELQNNPKFVLGASENVFTDGTSSTAFSKNERVVIKLKQTSDDEDGIRRTPSTSQKRGEMYDLSGRKLNKSTKGLYIQNGRKVLVK